MDIKQKSRMKSRYGILIILVLISSLVMAQQTTTRTFPYLAYQQIKLVGFEGFNTYTIDNVMVVLQFVCLDGFSSFWILHDKI